MENIKKPKRIQKETSVYDKVEAELLMSCLQKEETMWNIMIKIAITTGLRRGELLGLEWKHVDLEKVLFKLSKLYHMSIKNILLESQKLKIQLEQLLFQKYWLVNYKSINQLGTKTTKSK